MKLFFLPRSQEEPKMQSTAYFDGCSWFWEMKRKKTVKKKISSEETKAFNDPVYVYHVKMLIERTIFGEK